MLLGWIEFELNQLGFSVGSNQLVLGRVVAGLDRTACTGLRVAWLDQRLMIDNRLLDCTGSADS